MRISDREIFGVIARMLREGIVDAPLAEKICFGDLLTDPDKDMAIDALTDWLTRAGLSENDEPNEQGELIEAIIDKVNSMR